MHEDPIIKARRRRRTYTAQFKAELVAQCMDPTVSQAAVAIEHDMNPNVLRRWVIEHERLGLHELDPSVDAGKTVAVREPASWLPFVPVQAPRPAAPVAAAGSTRPLSTATIQVELAAGGLSMRIHWPATEHQALAQWTRQILS
jgi:Transposase and inactivated derivatives